MSRNESAVRRTLRRFRRGWSRVRLRAKAQFDLFDPVEVLGYRSHGRPDELRVVGRVLERRGVEQPREGQGLARNILNTIRRFESDEIPAARLRARLGDACGETETDREGFFEINLRPALPLPPGWHRVELELLASVAGGAGTRSAAEVMVPPGDAGYCVISDIDDTVIHTRATDPLTQAWILLANSATSHSVMPGAGALYRALEAGPDRDGWKPFFYVSMSGWGLYDLFENFLDANELPKGAVFLQDLAILEEKSEVLGSHQHKHETIRRVMGTYPDLKFVLIGDSGQQDPETFRDIVRERKDRVRAVLVRDVTPPARDREVRRIVQEVEDLGVPMAAAESSVSLARAAADFGLIHHDAIADVRRAMVEEEG